MSERRAERRKLREKWRVGLLIGSAKLKEVHKEEMGSDVFLFGETRIKVHSKAINWCVLSYEIQPSKSNSDFSEELRNISVH